MIFDISNLVVPDFSRGHFILKIKLSPTPYGCPGRRKQHEAAGAAIYGGHFIILSLVKIVSTKLLK